MALGLSPGEASYGFESPGTARTDRRGFLIGLSAIGLTTVVAGTITYPKFFNAQEPHLNVENFSNHFPSPELISQIDENTLKNVQKTLTSHYNETEATPGFTAIVAAGYETNTEIIKQQDNFYVGELNYFHKLNNGPKPSWQDSPETAPAPIDLKLVDPNTGEAKTILMSPDREIFSFITGVIDSASAAGKPLSIREIEQLEFVLLMARQTRRNGFSEKTKQAVALVTQNRCGITGQTFSNTHGEQRQFHHADLDCSNDSPNNCIGLLLRVHRYVHLRTQHWDFNDRWYKNYPIPDLSDAEIEIVEAWISANMPGSLDIGDVFAELIEDTFDAIQDVARAVTEC